MVTIRYFPLTIILLLMIMAGCASPGTETGARVEDRSRPLEEDAPAATESKQAPAETVRERRQTPDEDKKEEYPDSVTESREQLPPGDHSEPSSRLQTGPAVIALLDDADNFTGRGNNQQAIASLERALRIEPKNPLLWSKLSHLHLLQGNRVQAIAMAKKSNVLASGDKKLQNRNWQIIARAREGLGDTAGAEEALQKAQSLSP